MQRYVDLKAKVYAEKLRQLLQLCALWRMLVREKQLPQWQPLLNGQLRGHASQNPHHL